ncbi:MAG: hypothetical protein QOH43_2054, partial [Solirubrobacteraceae bacterium]|nr:hypothetical protein [Solirubrobacteraceae bacterium]
LAIAFAVLLVAGMVIAAIGTSTTLDATGLAMGGVACVGLVSTAFWAVGRSEDRQRERDRRPGG